MKEKLLWGSLIFLGFYMMLPWIITRIMGIGIFRRGRVRKQVAFTFDDGPDPKYTPLMLDLLARHNVKATFFVLGSKAEKYPELVRRIHEAGHQIGIHNYTHLSNWLMTPWTVKRKQVDRSANIVQSITGIRPVCYRPPWGIINLFDFFLKKRYQIILWSVMPRDWRSSIGAERMKGKILRRVKDGSVILLHDSGETFGADRDAPEQTMLALEQVIPELRERGYMFSRIDEIHPALIHTGVEALGISKRLLVFVWMLWEKCFLWLFHVEAVDDNNPLLKFRVTEYHRDQTLILSDGEEIRKGDQVLELHLDNNTLFRLGAEARTSVHLAIQLIHGIEQLLPQVIKMIHTKPQYRDVKGLYGISIIHRGTKQLGFTVVDLPEGFFTYVTQLYLRLLMYAVHPHGRERLKTKTERLVPKIIAMSRKELMNRYVA